jgi:hypothetical protein
MNLGQHSSRTSVRGSMGRSWRFGQWVVAAPTDGSQPTVYCRVKNQKGLFWGVMLFCFVGGVLTQKSELVSWSGTACCVARCHADFANPNAIDTTISVLETHNDLNGYETYEGFWTFYPFRFPDTTEILRWGALNYRAIFLHRCLWFWMQLRGGYPKTRIN